jgi:hypothetical protein
MHWHGTLDAMTNGVWVALMFAMEGKIKDDITKTLQMVLGIFGLICMT